MDGQWLRLSRGNAARATRSVRNYCRQGGTITAPPRAAWCHIERLGVAHLLLAHKNFQSGEDGIGPAPSGGAVAAAARASASPRSRHRTLFYCIVPWTELYFTHSKPVPSPTAPRVTAFGSFLH